MAAKGFFSSRKMVCPSWLTSESLPCMIDGARMIATAEGGADGLMAETDAEDRNARAEALDRVAGNARFFGRAGAGRDDDLLGPQRFDLVQTDLVVAKNLHLGAEFAEIVIEVVGEGVVVVDEQRSSLPPLFGEFDGFEHGARFVQRLLILQRGIGVGDDAGAGVDENFFAFHDDGANDDAGVEVAVVAEVADGAGVKPALLRLQLADDLHGADFRRAGYRAGGKGRDEQIEGGLVRRPACRARWRRCE